MLKLNHTYKDQDVIDLVKQHNPSRKQSSELTLRKWREYQEHISRALFKAILFADQDQLDLNQAPIQWDDIRQYLGRNRRFYYLPWFHEHFPLVKIIDKGYPGHLTMIEPLFDIKIAASSQSPRECFQYTYRDQWAEIEQWIGNNFQSQFIDYVSIDQHSLEAYIRANQALQRTANSQLLNTLDRNNQIAQVILKCSQFMEKVGIGKGIPQVAKESDFGRRYYQGLNLQNIPKIVRHAAMGRCWQYDLESSVFSWQYVTIKQIDPELSISYTLEYLDHKQAIRKRLANLLEINMSFQGRVDLIKQIMSAIGHGARPSQGNQSFKVNGRWQQPSIQMIIKSPEARKQLFQDPWLKNFILEQRMIVRKIADHNEKTLKVIPELVDQDGLIIRGKAMSFLYQHWERSLIDQLQAPAKNREELLLSIHDGFYTNVPQRMVEMRECLHRVNPWAKISVTGINAYGFNDDSEHKAIIREAELEANEGTIPYHIEANNRRIAWMREQISKYNYKDEFDNGQRLEPRYDPELDPFFD